MSWTFYNSDGEALVQHAESEAVQSEMEAETAVAKFVPPDLVKFHPGVAKAHVRIVGSDGSNTGFKYGVDSTSRAGVGNYRGTLEVTLSALTDINPLAIAEDATGTHVALATRISTTQWSSAVTNISGAGSDGDNYTVVFGDFP